MILKIQTTIDNSSQVTLAEINELSEQYNQACQKINDRLIQCATLLREGNLAEASRICETFHVLDDFQALKFDNLEQWIDLVINLAEGSTVSLQNDLAEELYLALNELNSIESLLDHFRLMSYANAPLKNRLNILRKLVALNQANMNQQDNIGWVDDLRDYERERFLEFERAIPQVKTQEMFTNIYDEVMNTQWTVSLPTQLKSWLESEKRKYDVEQVNKRLGEIQQMLSPFVEKMQQAYGRRDKEAVADLAAQWQSLLDETNALQSPIPEGFRNRVAQALKWLENEKILEKRRSELLVHIKAMGKLIGDPGNSIPTLDAAWLDLSREADLAQTPLPDELIKTYKKRVRWANNRANMKYYLLGFFIFLVVASVSGRIGYGVYLKGIESKREAYIESLQETERSILCQFDTSRDNILSNASAIDNANKVVKAKREEGSPFLKDPKVQQIMNKIVAYGHQLARARREYDDEFQRIAKLIDTQLETNSIRDWSNIEDLEKIANTPRYKTIVDNYRKQFNQKQTTIDKQLQTMRDECLEKLTQIKEESVSMSQQLVLFRDIQQIRDAFVEQSELASPSKKRTFDEFVSMIDKELINIDRLKIVTGLIERLSESLDSADNYKSALDNISKFSEFEFSAKYQLVAKQYNAWKKIEGWNAFISNHLLALMGSSSDYSDVSKMISDWNSLNLNTSYIDSAPMIEKYISFIKGSKESKIADITEDLRKVLIFDSEYSHYVFIKDNDWYYFKDMPISGKNRGNKYTIKRNEELENSLKNNPKKDPNIRSSIQFTDSASKEAFLAPDSKLCQDLINQLNYLSFDNMDFKVCEMLRKVYREENLDPIRKCYYLSYFLEAFSNPNKRSSYYLIKNLTPLLDHFEGLDLENDCMTPGESTRIRREMAKTILKGLNILDSPTDSPNKDSLLATKIQEEKAEFQKITNARYECIGYLQEENDVKLRNPQNMDTYKGTLYIASMSDNELILKQVGRVADGTFSWTANSNIIIGTPIYYKENSKRN